MNRHLLTNQNRCALSLFPRDLPQTQAKSAFQGFEMFKAEFMSNTKRLFWQMTLGHELGAGAACLKCKDKCEGFELHFWRFVYKSILVKGFVCLPGTTKHLCKLIRIKPSVIDINNHTGQVLMHLSYLNFFYRYQLLAVSSCYFHAQDTKPML